MGLCICWESVDLPVRGALFRQRGGIGGDPPTGEVLPVLPVDSAITVCATRTPSPQSRRPGGTRAG
jgi:hypothetical protein